MSRDFSPVALSDTKKCEFTSFVSPKVSFGNNVQADDDIENLATTARSKPVGESIQGVKFQDGIEVAPEAKSAA
jgi:hypothetical protein